MTADIDEVMYSCGMEILHPGGLQKSEDMAVNCGISADTTLLDIGSGKGTTACFLAGKYGCRITGVDQSEAMIEIARERAAASGISKRVDFIRTDASELPFPENSFDIVITECATSLMNKTTAFTEMLRVLKPGGRLGDLEMIWRKEPGQNLTELVYREWDGFETLTKTGWMELLKGLGLVDLEFTDFSELIPKMKKNMLGELGAAGILKLCGKLLIRPDLLFSMMRYNRIFDKYSDYIGYAWFTGRKSPK